MFKADTIDRIHKVIRRMIREHPEYASTLEFADLFNTEDPEDYQRVKSVTDYLKRNLTNEEIEVAAEQVAINMCSISEFDSIKEKEKEYERFKIYVRNTILYGPPVIK